MAIMMVKNRNLSLHRLARRTGMAMTSGRVEMIDGITSSFQERMNMMTPQEAIPGAESGRIIRRKAWIRLQPSMRAASSRSRGSVAKKPARIQIA